MATSSSSQQNEGDQECQLYQMTCKKCDDIIPTLPTGKGWFYGPLFQYQGFWISETPLKQVMLILDHFRARPTDIILATYPKCGTTWLRALVYATMHRTSHDFATHPLLTTPPRDLIPFLEPLEAHENDCISFLEALPSPRILSTHIPYTWFPNSVKASGCKFVYMCRNPNDVVVSLWKFTQKLRSKELPALSLQEAFELFCNGVSSVGPFWDHALAYWKASSQAPEILFLVYEDMKREPLVQVKRLAEFLGKPFSTEEESRGAVQEIVRLCSFENLSTLDVNKTTNSQYLVKNSYFFRKGEVGDWKNHLTPEMASRLDQITKEKLHGFGLTFSLSP